MHYAVLFLKMFFPLEILLIGIITIIITGLLSTKITQRFPYLKSRMRILYGYMVVVSSIVSMISFWYIYNPFETSSLVYFNTQISQFTAGAYIVVGIATVIVSFMTIVEINLDSHKNYLLFISLLMLEGSSWFITTSDSWINILFGFILIYISTNVFIHGIYEKQESGSREVITNYLTMSSMSISLLFVGIACLSFSGNGFILTVQNTTRQLWEYIGIIFVIISLLIQIGVPPFHNWYFKAVNKNLNSTTSILLLFQRGLGLIFLIKYSSTIASSEINSILLWLFTSLGAVYTLWGVFGAITENSLQKLIHYISLFYIGIFMLILSDIFSSTISQEMLLNSLKSVNFGVLIYMILFSFSLSLLSSISKGLKSEEISILGSIGRNSITQFIVNLINVILLFLVPIAIYIISKKYSFDSTFSPRMYFVSILLITILVFSIVYFFRFLKALFSSEKRYKLQLTRIEPATVISSIIMFVIIISFMILIVQILSFCSLISLFLLS